MQATVTAGAMAGIIDERQLYTIDAIKRRLRIGNAAWRTLADSGFPVIAIGRQKYVVGRRAIEFFDGLAAPTIAA